MDLGIARDFRFRERFRVQIRGEAFNLFNHPNLGLPNMQIGNPLVGTISTVINPERQIQAAMKLYFWFALPNPHSAPSRSRLSKGFRAATARERSARTSP